MSVDMKKVALAEGISPKLLAPDHSRQKSRIIVPCAGIDRLEWRRSGAVTALGQLLMALGQR